MQNETPSLEIDEWLTIGEAAAYLNLHRETLRRAEKRGLLPKHLTPGGHRRYRIADLDALFTPKAAS